MGFWGATCIYPMSIPRWIHRREPKLVPIRPCSRLTASQDFWMFDPLKPSGAPLVSRRAICLAYIHSQMDLHMCAKFDDNRSSRLTASTDFWICDPLNPPPPKCPLGYWGTNLCSLCRFPDESADVYQIWCQSVQPFDNFLKHLNLRLPKPPPPQCPWGIAGELYLAYIHSQTNPPTCTKCGANRCSCMTASQDFWICEPPPPPQMPPEVTRGDLDLACVHSQMNPQTWTKFGANRYSRLTASQDFWMFDP